MSLFFNPPETGSTPPSGHGSRTNFCQGCH